jgi:hypothetical protein
LSDNRLGNDGVVAVLFAARRCPRLDTFDLSGNGCTVVVEKVRSDFVRLALLAARDGSVDLSDCKLTDAAADAALREVAAAAGAGALQSTTSVTALDLSGL